MSDERRIFTGPSDIFGYLVLSDVEAAKPRMKMRPCRRTGGFA